MAYANNDLISAFLSKLVFDQRSSTIEDFSAEDTYSSAILFCVNKVKDSAVVEGFFIALLEVGLLIV